MSVVPVLGKIHPVKCCDFAKRRRFPVRFPRFTVVFPDFQMNNTQGGDYRNYMCEKRACQTKWVEPFIFSPMLRQWTQVVAKWDLGRVGVLSLTHRSGSGRTATRPQRVHPRLSRTPGRAPATQEDTEVAPGEMKPGKRPGSQAGGVIQEKRLLVLDPRAKVPADC